MNQELIKQAIDAIMGGADQIAVSGDTEKVIAHRNKRSGNIMITIKQAQGQGQSA
ncbi:hypothetical protein EDC14_1004136 [Hydrogenispora ethanolica]|uniref:Uncharacterized protein n=1 Tax=Hydrogenispora ethanolica TaxID=1082276 RepID=A0A4R1S4P9_HYDET|nr:hypothetical protein [Hydrogenispora ethanolica]TCL74198.1 hypothetical protein EDC14_1004136 [Hydrogenispora ethanolica]